MEDVQSWLSSNQTAKPIGAGIQRANRVVRSCRQTDRSAGSEGVSQRSRSDDVSRPTDALGEKREIRKTDRAVLRFDPIGQGIDAPLRGNRFHRPARFKPGQSSACLDFVPMSPLANSSITDTGHACDLARA